MTPDEVGRVMAVIVLELVAALDTPADRGQLVETVANRLFELHSGILGGNTSEAIRACTDILFATDPSV